jgi:hypothetical protein
VVVLLAMVVRVGKEDEVKITTADTQKPKRVQGEPAN